MVSLHSKETPTKAVPKRIKTWSCIENMKWQAWEHPPQSSGLSRHTLLSILLFLHSLSLLYGVGNQTKDLSYSRRMCICIYVCIFIHIHPDTHTHTNSLICFFLSLVTNSPKRSQVLLSPGSLTSRVPWRIIGRGNSRKERRHKQGLSMCTYDKVYYSGMNVP